jgi:glycosyltransferase involved in cell wall biosynthesis
VEPGNPTALANAIGALLRDPSLRERLVRNGANRVQTMFSFPARMRREEQFYRAVLDRPDGPANLVGRAEA